MAATTPLSSPLLRRGLYLEYLTRGWNVVGASLIVVWQLKGIGQDRERTALRLIGASFFALALYVLAQAAYALLSASHPAQSPGGIAWLATTLMAMLLLAWGKLVTGRQLAKPVLMTEARVTLIDRILAAVLAGLLLNALFGWWWADPLAGLAIVYYGLKEDLHACQEGEPQ